jgi:hypothetical protein
MKKLESFKTTEAFFDYIGDLLSAKDGNKTKEAGDLFEEFTCEWHLEFNDYIAVYDANNIHSIPSHIIDKIDGWELLQKGANSFGIDKICVARNDGRIDVHQDKSTLHMDKKLGTDKAAKMMSLRDNPLKNIRHFVINTTAQDLSHYARLWKDQTPLTYGYDKFVASEDDAEAISRDKMFWDNIRAKKKGKPTTSIFGFVSRGPQQDDYINAGIAYAKKAFQTHGRPKWHQLGVGALGKSVLDPIILAELEYLFNPAYTKTPRPVSVSFYHSSKTLPKNGWEEVMRRRAKGVYDEVIVVSGTAVIDGENDINLSTPFPKTTSVASAVVKIKEALDNDKSVLLLTLYHHAGQIEQIKKQLNRFYSGFKYWYRKRDECDWPCSNADSSFAPALDDRTESILTYGSSGTERLGKDPLSDYGLNNINIHGVCAHNFTWAQAESAGLVKPLILIMPCVKESEVAQLFPEFVDQNGRVDWNMRVRGVPVDNTYPTAGLVADLVALAKTLVEYPEVKRLLTFSHQVKTNKLAEMNWPWICKKVLGNSNIEKSVKKLFWQVLNDDAYNSASTKDHTTAIKRAKAHDRYAIGSCKVFGRGYDDKFSPKHHAAVHFDNKTIVTAVQEIWRVTRTDIDPKTNKPVCGDPNAYYILPMRFNDIGDKPTFGEDRLEQLLGILQFNKNIFDEFQSLVQNPNGSKKKQDRSLNSKVWIPEDFDPATFGGLITWVAQKSKGQMIDNIVVEAHTWLLKKYLSLPEVTPKLTSPINQEFLVLEEFSPLFNYYKLYKTNPRTFREKFWAGDYVLKGSNNFSQETKDQITQNLIEFKLFKDQCETHKGEIIEVMKSIAEKEIPKQLAPDGNYSYIGTKLSEEFGLPKHQVQQYVTGPLTKKWYANKLHWKNTHRVVYNLLAVNAEGANSLEEWSEKVVPLLEEHRISTYNVAAHTLRKRFINKDFYNALSKEEFEVIRSLADQVKKRAYLANGASKKGKPSWNSGIDETDPRYKEWVEKVATGREKYYK